MPLMLFLHAEKHIDLTTYWFDPKRQPLISQVHDNCTLIIRIILWNVYF